MISASAGIGRPVCGPAKDFDRRAFDGAGELVFRAAVGQIFEAGDEQRRILAVHDRDRAALAAIPIFLGDDRAVPAAVIELHRDLVRAVHLDAIDRGVDPAGVGIAHDDQRAGADERPAVVAVPDRRREAARYRRRRRRSCCRGTRRVLTVNRRLRRQGLALLHPGLERVERPQRRIEPERQRCALHVGRGIGEDAKAGRKALDIVEQQRRAVGQAGRDLGNAADLEARIGAFDAAQRAELVDGSDEFAQVLIHVVAPAIWRKPSHACARLRWQVKEFSFLAKKYK